MQSSLRDSSGTKTSYHKQDLPAGMSLGALDVCSSCALSDICVASNDWALSENVDIEDTTACPLFGLPSLISGQVTSNSSPENSLQLADVCSGREDPWISVQPPPTGGFCQGQDAQFMEFSSHKTSAEPSITRPQVELEPNRHNSADDKDFRGFEQSSHQLSGIKILEEKKVTSPERKTKSEKEKKSGRARNPLVQEVNKRQRTCKSGHHEIEKRYRMRLNSNLENLRQSLPKFGSDEGGSYEVPAKSNSGAKVKRAKVRKAAIISEAIDYIKCLERDNLLLEKQFAQAHWYGV